MLFLVLGSNLLTSGFLGRGLYVLDHVIDIELGLYEGLDFLDSRLYSLVPIYNSDLKGSYVNLYPVNFNSLGEEVKSSLTLVINNAEGYVEYSIVVSSLDNYE